MRAVLGDSRAEVRIQFGQCAESYGGREDLGVLLSPANVEEQISSLRAQQAVYRASHSKALAGLEQMAVGVRSKTGGSRKVVWHGDLPATL